MNYLEEQFRQFLINKGYKVLTPSGNPSTVYDYCKRIAGVCADERLTWEALASQINRFVIDYGVGGIKEANGRKSHNSVISALRAYKIFVENKK